MKWFKGLFRKKAAPLTWDTQGVGVNFIVPPFRAVPFPQGYTLERWLADPNLAEQAQKLYSEGLFQNIMAVAYNSIPRGYPSRGDAVNESMALIEFGRYLGYMGCIDLINSLAVSQKATEESPIDWNAPPEP